MSTFYLWGFQIRVYPFAWAAVATEKEGEFTIKNMQVPVNSPEGFILLPTPLV